MLNNKLKIVLIAPANSVHTIKWANGLSSIGHNVHLISIHAALPSLSKSVCFNKIDIFGKFTYLLGANIVRKLVSKLSADIVNVHYASGYGFLCRKIKHDAILLSVWGSDIYEFPNKSYIHRYILKSNMKNCSAVASTSFCMGKEARKYFVNKPLYITPFGVDTNQFNSIDEKLIENKTINFAIFKSLKSVYAIDIAIKAFSQLISSNEDNHLCHLNIYGSGPELSNLKKQIADLDLNKYITLHGSVSNERVPHILGNIDVCVALSRHESFGVSVLEANSCSIPVIVSEAPGLIEIVSDGYNGIVVPIEDVESSSIAMKKLLYSSELRLKLGVNGRSLVTEKYSNDKCLRMMVDVYYSLINKDKF